MVLLSSSAVAILLLISKCANAYIFDTAPGPGYPVILPPPWNMTFADKVVNVDPCTLQVTVNVPQGSDVDLTTFVRTSVSDYINSEVYYLGTE